MVPIPQKPPWLVACVKILAGLSPQSLSVYEDLGGQSLPPTLQPTLPSAPFLREATETWRSVPGQAQLSPTDLSASLPQQLPDVAVIRKLIYNTGRSQSRPIGASDRVLGQLPGDPVYGQGWRHRVGRGAAWEMPGCASSKASWSLPSSGPSTPPLHGVSFYPGHIRQTQPLIHLPTQRAEKTPASP